MGVKEYGKKKVQPSKYTKKHMIEYKCIINSYCLLTKLTIPSHIKEKKVIFLIWITYTTEVKKIVHTGIICWLRQMNRYE